MKKILLALLLLLGCGGAYAQYNPANCATGVACTATGPVSTGSGDPWYIFAYKYNTSTHQLFNMFGPTSSLALTGTSSASDIINLFPCGGNPLLFVNGAGGCTAPGGGGGGGVTSIGVTVPSFLSVSPSTITTSGIFAITLSGTPLPQSSGGTGANSLTGASIPVQVGVITSGDCVQWASSTSITDSGGGCGAGSSSAFSALTTSTNVLAHMTVGTGAILDTSGAGSIVATSSPLAGITGLGTNVAAFLGTPSSANLAAALTDETGTGFVVFSNNPVLITPNLGTPSAVNLTNGVNLPVSTGISGLATGVATFLATPTSANFAAAITNETGTGLVVLNNTPTFITPILGAATASSFTDSGITGLTQCIQANSAGLFSGTGSACGSGGSTAFSGLTSGTNTGMAALVGTGASLGPTGTGVVNANQINGAVNPTSAALLASNSSAQNTPITVGTGLGISSGVLAPSAVINAQTGTTYTYLATDGNKLVTHNNAGAIAATLPVATTTGFGAGFGFTAQNIGAGTLTITPTTSTINGASSLSIASNRGCDITSDGTNYQVSACTALVAGGGSLNASGTPTVHQTAIWVTSTTLEGIATGSTGQALVSGGASADPAYSALLPGVTSVNGSTIPSTAGTLPGSTGSFTVGHCVTVGGTGPLQISDSGGNCGGSLTAGQVGYGNGSNLLTGTPDFLWLDGSTTLILGATTAGNLTAASGSAAANGQALNVTGGAGGSTSGTGGATTVSAGSGIGTTSGNGGALSLFGGAGSASAVTGPASGGNVVITAGAGGSTTSVGVANGGNVSISAGSGGAATASATAGTISITTGSPVAAANANGGTLNFNTGAGAGTGFPGSIIFKEGSGTTLFGLVPTTTTAVTITLGENVHSGTITNIVGGSAANTQINGVRAGQLVANGTSALATGAISSGTCATAVTTSATGVATTDVVNWGFNGDPTAVTGYTPSASGMLTIIAYPSANNVNFKVCNNTSSSITPGAITLNWNVPR